jgi:putative transposase
MVQYRRSRVAGGAFFFTVNLRNRRDSLLVDHADALRQIVSDVRVQLPFNIDAMVVLPDHWHAVWTLPLNDQAYASRIRLIKARFTKHLLREGVAIAQDDRGEYKLWQRRFWEHTVRDDHDFETHVNYVHINPVKHGYAKRPADWAHSTIHRFIANGTVTSNWAVGEVEGKFGEQSGDGPRICFASSGLLVTSNPGELAGREA